MKTKHTKGEWVNEGIKSLEPNAVSQISTDGGFTLICDVFGLNKEESEANAKLIAAAPELLKSLINLIDKCNILPNSKCDENENPLGSALQAIKKATE